MFYTVYKITNNINGKSYIGSHKTKDINDSYMGSGKYLKYAQEKYGIENFTKEILFVFDDPALMYAKEAELVNSEFISENNTYNIKVGGFGGFDYINHNKLNLYPNKLKKDLDKLKLASKAVSELNKDSEWKQQQSLKISVGLKKRFKTTQGNFTGKTHTEETKNKIRAANSKMVGCKNSQYGTMWITNGQENKKIKKDVDIIPEGWYKGRK
jgi:hypothetical protein